MRLIAGDANSAKNVSGNIDSRIEKAVSEYMKGNSSVNLNKAAIKANNTSLVQAKTPVANTARKKLKIEIVHAKGMKDIDGFELFAIDNWGGQLMATLQSKSGSTKSINQGEMFGGYVFHKIDKTNNSVLIAKDGRTWELK